MKLVSVGLLTILFFVVFSYAHAATDTAGVNLSVTVGESMTVDCGSDVDIDGGGTLVAGVPVSNSTTCTVTTNDEDGYNLQVNGNIAPGTSNVLANGSGSGANYEIADKPVYDGVSPTVPTTWSGTGLGYSVYASTATKNTTLWGNGSACHDGANLYAGFDTAPVNIMEHPAYASTSTTTSICYRTDVPSAQASGEYTGSVLYTATGRP